MTMQKLERVNDIPGQAVQYGSCVCVVCAQTSDPESLEALRSVADRHIAVPFIVGEKDTIQRNADAIGIALDDFEFEHVSGYERISKRATELVQKGPGDLLMKGRIPTRIIMRAALDNHVGLKTSRIFSHVTLFDAPPLQRPIAMSDPAVNIRPNFNQKIEILKNAVEVMNLLGVDQPKVAMLAAIEKVQLPAMRATLDARVMERVAKAKSGVLRDVVVQGPLALDDAVSPKVVQAKGIAGPVAGNADILIAPEIETANVLYKALTCFAGLEGASIVVGGRTPIIVPGRADTSHMKFLSIALGVLLLHRSRECRNIENTPGPTH